MPAAVVDGNLWRWKVRVGKRAHRDAHRLAVAFLGVKDGRSTDWAEPEDEPRALIPSADIFGGGAEDFERRGEAGERREDTAGPLLARKAVANANPSRLAFHLNTQLSAGA